ncbi:MAG: ATP-binding protein [Lachnospiraceae bacterium]|nr:ATP-binding protein [Lachnospiraceae bacterium]
MSLSNSKYDEIMHGYENRRAFHRQEQNDHKDYVYEHVPGYEELDQLVSTTAFEHAKARLSGQNVTSEDLRNKLARIKSQKEALLKEAGLPKDYLELKYDCPDCQDTGYIGNQKCHCFRQKIIECMYEESNIQRLAEKANFSLLKTDYYTGEHLDRFQRTLSTCEDFINNFGNHYQNIFFYGTVGTGKTFLSICIAKELLDRGNTVLYFSAVGLFDALSQNTFSYGKADEKKVLIDDLYNCDLLIIDDLGTERTNSFVSSELFSCLNERDIRKKSTIITTNLSIKDIKSTYSDRIFSRLLNNYLVMVMTSERDIRFQKKLISKKESEDIE